MWVYGPEFPSCGLRDLSLLVEVVYEMLNSMVISLCDVRVKGLVEILVRELPLSILNVVLVVEDHCSPSLVCRLDNYVPIISECFECPLFLERL